jgi:signal transduction histidine kinase
MNNAIKFTNMGGKITIKGKLYDNINGRMIRVEIKDNGIGLRSD